MRHSPVRHSEVACGSSQALPQAPQLSRSLRVLISQAFSLSLSQLAKPSSHSLPQMPSMHSALAQSLADRHR